MSYYEDLTKEEEHILQVTTTLAGTISIVSCLFVVWTYLRFRELIRVFNLRIILYLTLTDLLWLVQRTFHILTGPSNNYF